MTVLNPALLALGWWLQLGQLQIPPPVGFVNDFARVIRADAAARMSSVIATVRARSRGEIVVVTLPDLRGRDVADVAREIGRQWRVGATGEAGDRARNAGVIILLSPRETNQGGRGAVRVEVGNGAEGFITDAIAGAIQDEAIDFLRSGDYSRGLELITTRVAERYAREFGFALGGGAPAPTQSRRGARGLGISPELIFGIIFVLFFLARVGGRRRRGGAGNWLLWAVASELSRGGRRGGWSGGGLSGGGGGGFSGFGGFGGGGGFSGGGAGRSF